MLELLFTIVLLGSLIGMATIVYRKLPILAQLPVLPQGDISLSFWQRMRKKVGDSPFFKAFSGEKLLHKLLSKLKNLALRTESKTEKYLRQLREKSQKQKQNFKDNYWQELRETKDNSSKRNIIPRQKRQGSSTGRATDL